MKYNTNKTKGSSEDELEQFYERNAKITTLTGVVLAGKVISISDIFVGLRFRDGREARIKRSQIAVISQLPVVV